MSVGKLFTRLFGIQTGADAYQSTITLGDRDRQFRVVLDPGLPDDAYRQLFDLDLTLVPPGVLTWDGRLHGWQPSTESGGAAR